MKNKAKLHKKQNKAKSLLIHEVKYVAALATFFFGGGEHLGINRRDLQTGE